MDDSFAPNKLLEGLKSTLHVTEVAKIIGHYADQAVPAEHRMAGRHRSPVNAPMSLGWKPQNFWRLRTACPPSSAY